MTASDGSGKTLTPPRAAAVAGVIFSVLMILSLGIVRLAVSFDQTNSGVWLTDPVWRGAVRFAINLVPFAGIAFLWFLGVIRNRLGALEDQFFATVWLGSGLLFIASLFAAAAAGGSLVQAVMGGAMHPPNSETYQFVRRLSGAFMNIFAIKMAGVFMFSTCTIALRTAILPRWVVFSGFACGLVLLLVITSWPWIAVVFPMWILLVSAHVLTADLRRKVLTHHHPALENSKSPA